MRGVSVHDTDAAEAMGGTVRVSLSVVNGDVTLSSTDGLQLLVGTEARDRAVVWESPVEDASAALKDLTYTPDTGFSGSDTLTAVVSDTGNTGSVQ